MQQKICVEDGARRGSATRVGQLRGDSRGRFSRGDRTSSRARTLPMMELVRSRFSRASAR